MTTADIAKLPAINTSLRLFDLVRYMRSELHEAGLITDEEYSWLCHDSPMATDPKGGSPSRSRLEEYDELRARCAELTAALEKEKGRLDRMEEVMKGKDGDIWNITQACVIRDGEERWEFQIEDLAGRRYRGNSLRETIDQASAAPKA